MEHLGPYDLLKPGAIKEDMTIPFKDQGEVVGEAVVHPDGTMDVTIFDGPRAETLKTFLSGGTFKGYGMNVELREET